MAEFTGLKGFWKSFTETRKILLRNIKVLGLIMFPLTYQIIAVDFFVEEESSSACNFTGKRDVFYESRKCIKGKKEGFLSAVKQ